MEVAEYCLLLLTSSQVVLCLELLLRLSWFWALQTSAMCGGQFSFFYLANMDTCGKLAAASSVKAHLCHDGRPAGKYLCMSCIE